MRVLQVVTYISPDGAFGGPVRVALNQSKALCDRQHEVVVAAAAGGFNGALPEEYDGFPVKLFPGWTILSGGGFAGLVSPKLLVWLVRAVRSADVIHVHLARDLVTLPAAVLTLLTGKPLVVQTHGMIDKSTSLLAAPLDRFITGPVLRKASRVLFLTDSERNDLVEISRGECRLHALVNGIDITDILAKEQNSGPDAHPEVLYLARLHPRKRPTQFVKAASKIAHSWPNVRWTLVGPDEGEGPRVRREIKHNGLEDSVKWEGALSHARTLTRMSDASIYVLPAVNEPFGMTVIEAMSIGLPVVVTRSCGLARFVESNHAGIVCDESQKGLERAVSTLIEDSDLRISMGRNGRHAVKNSYSMGLVASQLIDVYQKSRKYVGDCT